MIGGLIGGALTLIALQVFSAGNGPARGGALMEWVSKGVQQIISPDRAAIPNLTGHGTTKKPAPAPAPSGGGSGAVDTGNTLPRNPTLWT